MEVRVAEPPIKEEENGECIPNTRRLEEAHDTLPSSILRATALKEKTTNTKDPVTEKGVPATLGSSIPTPPSLVAKEENNRIASNKVTTSERLSSHPGQDPREVH